MRYRRVAINLFAMGTTKSKEQVIIAQATGVGQTAAEVQQQQRHDTTNYLLIVICTVMLIGALWALYKLTKKCHDKQIDRRLNDERLMRYSSILRRHQLKTENV